MNDNRKPIRTKIRTIPASGQELSDQHLRLVSGGMIKKPTYIVTRGAIDVCYD